MPLRRCSCRCWCRRLQAEQAHVDLRVVPLTSRDPRPMLEQGQADIALGFFPDVDAALAAEGDDGLLRLEPLYGCEYACVMRSGHAAGAAGALTSTPTVPPTTCASALPGARAAIVDEALARLGRERRVMITVSNFFTAGAVVHQSDLLTVLPRSFVPATGFASQLALAAVPFEMPGIEVGLLWHRRHEQDTGQRWLRDIMRRAAATVAETTHAAVARVGHGPRREQTLVRRAAAGMRAQLAGQRGVRVLPAFRHRKQLAPGAPLPLCLEAAPDGVPKSRCSIGDGRGTAR